MPEKIGWQWYALGSAFFASLTALFAKVGVSNSATENPINSNLATLIRTFVILPLLIAIVALRGEWMSINKLSGRAVLFLVLSGLATGLSWLCYYRALQLGPASAVAPVDKLSVAFVIILAAIFLHEALTWQVILGGSLIVAGAIVLTIS